VTPGARASARRLPVALGVSRGVEGRGRGPYRSLVTGWVALVSLLAAVPPAGRDDPAPDPVALAPPADARLVVHAPSRLLVGPRADETFTRSFEAAGAPPCVADVCQPRVAVPGYEQRISMRGKRTELAVKLLDRARLEPFASAFWFLAATGLRLDYTPPQFDNALDAGRGGWGHAQVLLRWRIDAWNEPVWPVRHR
jgi:hypothetical protein